jgi:hypothetical protein
MLLVITQYMQNVHFGLFADGCRVAPLAVQHEPDDRVVESGETRGSGRLRLLISSASRRRSSGSPF